MPRYLITVHCLSEERAPRVLSAEYHLHKDEPPELTSASIDTDAQGKPTLHGLNAFRGLALAEPIIYRALTTTTEQP